MEMKRNIEKFFDHKWVYEKNNNLLNEEYQNIVEQLPDEVINYIYCRFLYMPFMKHYSGIFEYQKNKNRGSRYVWDDKPYRSFMLAIIKSLEPRREDEKTILFEELDEFSELIFFMNGQYMIGYSINNQ